MESSARQRYIRMPARKLRRVINEVRGKSVTDAVNMLKFMPYFAAEVVAKNIKSAAANAAEKWGVDSSELIVSEVFADDGPTYKRAKPRAQGRVYKIAKRTSHLTVVVKVSEELKQKLERKKQAKKAQPKPAKEVKVEEKPELASKAAEEIKTEEPVEVETTEIVEEVKTESVDETKVEEQSEESKQEE